VTPTGHTAKESTSRWKSLDDPDWCAKPSSLPYPDYHWNHSYGPTDGAFSRTTRAPDLPAIAALISPRVWLRDVTATVFAICFSGPLIAGWNERFGAIWSLLQSVLFHGGALLVSLAVIILAGLRLASVLDVTTVFDTARGGRLASC